MRLTLKTSFLFFLVGFLISCCQQSGKEFTDNNYGDNTVSGKYLTRDTSKIYYETYGDSTNTPLVLIHGNGGSIASMSKQIDCFKKDYWVIIADNRTHGKSGDADSLTYELMAQDYLAILDALALDSTYVLGQSDGGIIGLIMAMEDSRIKKLVSIAPNLMPDTSAIESWEIDLSEEYIRFINSMIQSGDTSKNWNWEMTHMLLMKDQPRIELSVLSKIQCPVMVVASDKDIIKLSHILAIYEHIQKAQLLIMPGATHFMIRNQYEIVNKMTGRFLNEPFKRPTSEEVLLNLVNSRRN